MFHEHRNTERCPTCADWPEWAIVIIEQQEIIMSQQEDVDNDVKALTAAWTAEVDKLNAAEAAGQPLDLGPLNALAATVTAATAPAAPADPAAPAVPVVDPATGLLNPTA